MPLVVRTSVALRYLPSIGSGNYLNSMLGSEPGRHPDSIAAAVALACHIEAAEAREDPRVAVKDMAAGLAGPAVVDIAAGVERGPGWRTVGVAADCTHLPCLHLASGHFAHTHPEGAGEHAVASGPASWMPVQTSFVCEVGSSAEGVSWTRSWSEIDREEGQRRRCWRRRHLVDNSMSSQIHRDGGHRTGLADSLPFYLPTLITDQSLSRLCVWWPLPGKRSGHLRLDTQGNHLGLRCWDKDEPFMLLSTPTGSRRMSPAASCPPRGTMWKRG
jgi:hypothetical protein